MTARLPLGEPVTSRPVWRLASWNVLAQALCDPDRFPDVDPAALDVDARRAAVVAEVVRQTTAVDVVCLQEVDDALGHALAAAGLWVHAAVHDDGIHGVAVVAVEPLTAHVGALGGGRQWVAATLDDGDASSSLVVSCHLQHPGDGPVGSAQAHQLAHQLRQHVGGVRVAIGADANAVVGGPAADALATTGLELHQSPPTALIRGGPRTTDLLALPPGGRLTAMVGPSGPIPTTAWPSDHRLVVGEWPRR